MSYAKGYHAGPIPKRIAVRGTMKKDAIASRMIAMMIAVLMMRKIIYPHPL
jgi:hypothetical protein